MSARSSLCVSDLITPDCNNVNNVSILPTSVSVNLAPNPCHIPTIISIRKSKLHKTHIRRHVIFEHLRPLNQHISPSTHAATLIRMALFNSRSVNNKTEWLNNLFTSRHLDFLFLTETWIPPGDYTAFPDLLPPQCSFFNSPRSLGKGGGLATIYKSHFSCRLTPSSCYSSFELQLFELNLSSPVLFALVYRPPKSKDFINEFADFLATIILKYDHAVICGDMNIHVCCESRPLVKEFNQLLDSLNITRATTGPTHNKGHTLDLVLSFGLSTSICDVFPTPLISDHFPIIFTTSIPCSVLNAGPPARLTRSINPSTAPHFSRIFTQSPLNTLDPPCVLTSEALLSIFNSTCTGILDSVAPYGHKKAKKASHKPWLNDTTRALRRLCRRAERKWHKDKLHVSLDILRSCLLDYQRAVNTAKSSYFSNIVSTNSHKPQVLFNIFNSLTNPRDVSSIVPSLTLCINFQTFFISKIAELRAAHSSLAPDPTNSTCLATFTHFEPISLSALTEVVMHLRPSNCPSDCIPPRLLKEVFGAIGPSVCELINSCLTSGSVPLPFKHAIVHPLLKKKNLDTSNFSNFRPISQLPFLSKVLEKVVYAQLQSFLIANGLHETFQSGFKPGHSTESALLRVFNDLILTVDNGNPAALILLDLSAAFDTVDHQILLFRLEHLVGISGSVLTWFQSYLSERTFSVHIGDFASPPAPLSCGVPQGSILGPILFLLYILPLGPILQKHNMAFHCYADDVQIYLPLNNISNDPFQPLLNCIQDIKTWMDTNFLTLNENKTEIIIFDAPPSLPLHSLGLLKSNVCSSARNLGFILDSNFKLDKHISSVVKTSFFQLRVISKVKPFLPKKQLEMLIHALISSRLDYCNSLYIGIDQSQLQRLQLVQNSAARLLTSTKKRDHISPVLASLHWLPVKFRVEFKVLLFVFKSLHGLSPSYLKDLIHPYVPPRVLRSADKSLLQTLSANKRTRGDRAFAVAGPDLWNLLPLQIRSAESIGTFKSLLKTNLFSIAFNSL